MRAQVCLTAHRPASFSRRPSATTPSEPSPLPLSASTHQQHQAPPGLKAPSGPLHVSCLWSLPMDSDALAPTFHLLDFKRKNFPFLSCTMRPQTRAGRVEEEVEALSPAPRPQLWSWAWMPLLPPPWGLPSSSCLALHFPTKMAWIWGCSPLLCECTAQVLGGQI